MEGKKKGWRESPRNAKLSEKKKERADHRSGSAGCGEKTLLFGGAGEKKKKKEAGKTRVIPKHGSGGIQGD